MSSTSLRVEQMRMGILKKLEEENLLRKLILKLREESMLTMPRNAKTQKTISGRKSFILWV